MKKIKEFNFAKARRVTPEETMTFKKAIEETFHIKRPARGRPPKGASKYKDVHIRLNPIVIKWAHAQAKQRGVGYQTYINAVLLDKAEATSVSRK